MIEHIITKMVLDRTCPVCGGLSRYRTTQSARTETVECNNCSGKGYNSDCSYASVLLVPNRQHISLGIQLSMKQQNMYIVDGFTIESVRGLHITRLYTYNIEPDSHAFGFCKWRMDIPKKQRKPVEIHMYFD
jgi:hemolysin activation/secretion protein